jgi:UDP-glucose 4-epimerase
MGRIAITGTASYLGARVLRRLVDARGPDAVVAFDIAPPPATLQGVRHRMVDLTLPAADQRLLNAFVEEEVDTVFHSAFFTDPRRDTAYSHELESIGTLNVVAAAVAAKVKHFVQRSFTAVYGAKGQNPNFLTEEHTPRPDERLAWVRDKMEAEQNALSYARRYPETKFTILRIAPLLGPGVYNFYTRLFSKRVVSVLMGYDPLVQLLYPDDALDAIDAALEKSPGGIFNVVPKDTTTLLTTLHLAEKVTVAIPHPLAYALADLMWSSGVGEAPGLFLDYVRFLFVADGEKARRVLGFQAHHSSREALMAYLRYRYPHRYTKAPTQTAEATA